jgi:hypothetical protein
MSTKVKNIFSAKNLTQIFLGMAIIAVAGLNVKLAMRSQDWSFLSLMNIESLGQSLFFLEMDSVDSVADSINKPKNGPTTELKVDCTTTFTVKKSETTTKTTTKNPKSFGVTPEITVSPTSPLTKLGLAGKLGLNYSNGGKTETGTTTTSTSNDTTVTEKYILIGTQCPRKDHSVCSVFKPKCL